MFFAMAVFFAYQWIYNWAYPHTPPAAPTDAASQPASGPNATASAPGSVPSTAAVDTYVFVAGGTAEEVRIGGGATDPLEITLSPRGAGVRFLKLTRQKNARYIHRQAAESNEPYTVLAPVALPERELLSYAVEQLTVRTDRVFQWPLDDKLWRLESSDARSATFSTALRSPDGAEQLLQLTRSYTLDPQKSLLTIRTRVQNLSGGSLEASLRHVGPIGIQLDDPVYRTLRLVVARRAADQTLVLESALPNELVTERTFYPAAEPAFAWSALASKYFAVYTRPIGDNVDAVAKATGALALGRPELHLGDLTLRLASVPRTLGAGESTEFALEVYAGAKDEDELSAENPAYVDRAQLGYVAVHDFDSTCWCSWPFLTRMMTGLLEGIHFVVRNYGVAIIVIVIIVRGLLHPLTVFQQKSMYKAQESMARVQPKLALLKEKYANDRVRFNQEMMKVYAEENVNPAAPLVGMVPLFLQMPILIALWTALNNDIHLRHAPFDGWWIRDLSAPDALIRFGEGGLTIPVLSSLPLIGSWFVAIPSLNVLPVLMGVSMWLQQKYMPKPAMQAKLDAAKQQQATAPGGMTPEEQMRQQQMIANMMAIMMPVMFYYMPSGLNLYWMSTNVFGILESIRVRRQIDAEKLRRASAPSGPVKPTRPNPIAAWFKRMAEQAEELQKKADEISQRDPKTAKPDASRERDRGRDGKKGR